MYRMKIKDIVLSYDCDADTLYIQLRDTQVGKTVEYSDDIYVDIDSHGHIVGIEFLDPSNVAPADIRKIAAKFKAPDLKPINPRAVHEVYACA